jgi:hypothetical protein
MAANAGKIVFGPKPLAKDESDEETWKTAFGAEDAIYGRLFLEKPIVKTEIDGKNPANMVDASIHVLIDGKEVESGAHGSFCSPNKGALYTFSAGGDKMYTWETFSLFLRPETDFPHLSHPDVSKPSQAFADAVKELEGGEHAVQVEFRYEYNGSLSPALAAGEFQLSVDAGAAPTDFGRGLPEPAQKNEALEAEMREALKQAKWEYEVLAISIVSPDWQIHHDPVTHRITNRSVDTFVAFKLADGTFKAFNISFKQMFDSEKYGATVQRGVGENFVLKKTFLQ